MFKKFKDKLAEEVKSSPQRIQQFAQAAQAAVNSASSSISDITNNDLFSIGENETKPIRTMNLRPDKHHHQDTFQSVPLQSPLMRRNVEAMDNDNVETPRNRKLSNSSFASDISFKLPSYESPSMYHLQSDMDVSASEAEERGLTSPGGAISLDHVTKEQLYAAYRRTQDRYGKYRTRYSDLARHYKLLERENAKAKSVLVETQDKALRRISELREQCSLEQSAKAHLESALRVELDEKNMKIDSLTTKMQLLQENDADTNMNGTEARSSEGESQLIDLTDDCVNQTEESTRSDVNILNNKIEKMEQLLSKYKDSVKTLKDRNSQLITELQVVNSNFESITKENEELKSAADRLIVVQQEIQKLKDVNEDLQNTVNAYDFNNGKAIASLETDLKQAQEEISHLNSRIEVFNKREEEYAISLAENKLSIHKELESKEAEIKSLKDNLSGSVKEVQSLNIIVTDYKQSLLQLEAEKSKLNSEIVELRGLKGKLLELETEIRDLKVKRETQDIANSKTIEELKCMELQVKQETAEKLAMIDRNNYLENRNKQLSEENIVITSTITKLEKELRENAKLTDNKTSEDMTSLVLEKQCLLNEVTTWREKYNSLETEIHDEREELVKLQSEIEKLLRNHEMIQTDNFDLHEVVTNLKAEILGLEKVKLQNKKLSECVYQFKNDLKVLRGDCVSMFEEAKLLHYDVSKNILVNIEREIQNITECTSTKQDHVNRKYTEVIQELNNEITSLNANYINLEMQLTKVNKSNSELIEANREHEKEKQRLVANLEEGNKTHLSLVENQKSITKENESFKTQINKLLNDVIEIENKCKQLQESHVMSSDENGVLFDKCEHLKQEKEALYEKLLSSDQKHQDYENTIKKFEDKLKELDLLEQSHEQTKMKLEELAINNKILHEQLDTLKDVKSAPLLQSETSSCLSSDNSHTTDIELKFTVLENKYEKLKEEKSRLESEIEGLQAHLQKVSKDNTQLNDQLRETIASSEMFNVNEKRFQGISSLQNIESLQIELQEEKHKLIDLLRENSMLAEKNLELQDCIKSHHQNIDTMMSKNAENSSNKELEIMELQAKYNGLLQIKMELESKLAELELLGRSGDNGTQQLQDTNDKLKITNEKLERRLDEALVSLRHFRALEESTELEYLRNILYEYLTGTGTHSETLAKVLAAVVKFDEKQTQIILQKEKERQGLLRQLGLL